VIDLHEPLADDHRCSPVLLLASMAGAQVLLHETLMALTAELPVDMAGQMSPASASAMGGPAMAQADGWSVTMTPAHVVAAAATALLLARGEQALWQLVCRLLPALPSASVVVRQGCLQSLGLVSLPALRPSVASSGLGLPGPPVDLVAAA
jgi:hypothetical protein